MGRGPDPVEVILTARETNELAKLIKRHSTAQQIVLRARIIQMAAAGMNNARIGYELAITVDTVRLWRGRWVSQQEIPLDERSVTIRLEDAARSGSPGKFSAEQMAQIIAIACEEPQANGYPVSHWTPKEIVMEAVRRGIVVSISERQVGRFLKRGGVKTTSDTLLAQHD